MMETALGPRDDGDPLGALLGRTRAAALGLLAQQLTTTDIARELEISKSSAS
ncbi:helix-turn-helix domain-containing protein [Streptomyces sp. NPDC002215]|uniref:helix-turn-helix domain-containing protein n=1 Tax=Streptomyces sp. NPDC002215 TaxID=3154412 RepID=UPI00331AA3A8